MFEEAYKSTYHHPLAMWAVGLCVLALLLVRRRRATALENRFVVVWLLVFQLEIMLDAWMTGGLQPMASDSALATAAAVVFVIVGDLRFFVLFERFGPSGAGRTKKSKSSTPWTHWAGRALAISLVIPIVSNVSRTLWPGNMRVLFLTYELMFAVLAIVLRFVVLPRRATAGMDEVHLGFVKKATQFEIAQYVLWASADIVILSGFEVGYLLRIVPNMLYYAAFVPFIWWVAPKDLAP